MKVLLIGDFSGFHKSLAHGLRSQGLEVHVASSGDMFKGYERDINYGGPHRSVIQRFKEYFQLLRWFNEYDIIQLVSVSILREAIILFLLRSLFPKRARLYCATVGCDYMFWTEGRKNLDIPLFKEVIARGDHGQRNTYLDKILFKVANKAVEGFLGCYEYHEAYHSIKKRLQCIWLPVDLSKLHYRPLRLEENMPLIFFHAVSVGREGFKGSDHILKAFNIMSRRYPDKVKCIVKGGVPYAEFLETLKSAHVIFDQTNCHSYGMAALEGMAMGKVVACGLQTKHYWDKWCKEFEMDEPPPLLRITPDYHQIVDQIQWIIDNRSKLAEISRKGREYVEKYHDSEYVAELFLERWGVSGDLTNSKNLI